MIGVPVPSNLEEMSLEDLHAFHARIWAERMELKAKHASIMPVLQAKQIQRDIQTRAGFDTVIAQGASPLNVSVETAKELLSQAATGAISLGKSMLDRLKQIAGVQ
jgi:hypothetical protein